MLLHLKPSILKLVLFLVLPGVGWAEVENRERVFLPEVTVIGSKEKQRELSGSGTYVEREEISEKSYDDIHRILRSVPGVSVRDEDGNGFLTNISLRGTDLNRSSKLTMMEDGVLTAPAPYSAPEAYYSPAVGRMHGLEILKGSSQVKYGPHTIGGVVNYLSTPIPKDFKVYSKTMTGSYGELMTHSWAGQTHKTGAGQVGYVVELFSRETKGFKSIDPAPGEGMTGSTGFYRLEPSLKLSYEPNSSVYQRFEAKFGHTQGKADETYLGLSEEDYKATPFRRYMSTRFDNMEFTQNRSYLRHSIGLGDRGQLTSTLYYNDFYRNWYKLDKVDGRDLGVALADAGDLAKLRGHAAGDLSVKANNRNYYAWGLEELVQFDLESGGLRHELEVGLRYHTDVMKRFQHSDAYSQDANGFVTSVNRGLPGSGDDDRNEARALAVFVQDKLIWGDFSLTPGVRMEHVQMNYNNYKNGDERSGNQTAWAPGIGANYQLSEQTSLFAGIYRGISMPGPSDVLRYDIRPETSLNYEVGTRYFESNRFMAEGAVFFTDFKDLYVPSSMAAGTTQPDNGGNVRNWGLELKSQYDLAEDMDWALRNPWFVVVTVTEARLKGDAQSTSTGSIFYGGRDGQKMPYIPALQLGLGTALQTEKWGLEISGSYVDKVWSTAANVDETAQDVRVGEIPSYWVVDLGARYALSQGVTLRSSIHNLFNEEYMVARHPHGPRPGKPFAALVGLEAQF